MTLAEQIVSAAKAHGISIATAESCTGGMVAASLTDVPGSSAAFECGFVTYSNAAKQKMLGVLPATLEAHGAVSEPVALEMAQGALDASQATLSVAITGIAGPGGSDHKPEGRVCFAIAQSGRDATSQTIEFGALGRAQVRACACEHAKQLLLAAMTP